MPTIPSYLPILLNAVAALLLLLLITLRVLLITPAKERHDDFHNLDRERTSVRDSLLTAMSLLNLEWNMSLDPTPPEITLPEDESGKRGQIVYDAIRQQVKSHLLRLRAVTRQLCSPSAKSQNVDGDVLHLSTHELLKRIKKELDDSALRQDDIDKRRAHLERWQGVGNRLEVILPSFASLLIVVAAVVGALLKS